MGERSTSEQDRASASVDRVVDWSAACCPPTDEEVVVALLTLAAREYVKLHGPPASWSVMDAHFLHLAEIIWHRVGDR